MQLDLGVVSCTNLVMNDPDKSQVPMVSIYAGFVTLAHSRALEDSDIPTLPYLINKRDAEGEEMTMKLPTNEQLHEAVEEMLTDSEDPQFKNNMDQVRQILLHENQKELKGRLTELEQKDNENMSEVTNIKLLTIFLDGAIEGLFACYSFRTNCWSFPVLRILLSNLTYVYISTCKIAGVQRTVQNQELATATINKWGTR